MNTLPDHINLPASGVRLGLLAALLFAAAVASAWAAHWNAIGWIIGAGTAGLGMMLLLAITRGPGVSLDRDGFTVRNLWGEQRHAWGNVSEFKIGPLGKGRAIRFQDSTRTDVLSGMRGVTGRGNSAISPLVVSGGLSNACELLNAFRTRALAK